MESKRSKTIIHIPQPIFQEIQEISKSLHMSFSTVFKIMMSTAVHKYIKTNVIPLSTTRKPPISKMEKKALTIDQTNDWKSIKKKAKEMTIFATDLLVILITFEIEEYNKNKRLTIQSV